MFGVTELGPFIVKKGFFLGVGGGRGTLSSIDSDLKSFMVPEEMSIKIHTKMISSKGWLGIAKLKPLSLFISLLLML